MVPDGMMPLNLFCHSENCKTIKKSDTFMIKTNTTTNVIIIDQCKTIKNKGFNNLKANCFVKKGKSF